MHAGTISIHAQDALGVLGKSGVLAKSYLAGGTALALHLGHRMSQDFDFYTKGQFSVEALATDLAKLKGFIQTDLIPPHTLIGTFQDVKFSLFRYDYPLIDTVKQFQHITIAGIKDIAAMKLTAICGRATKRDYIDLFILQKQFSFETMLSWYEQKFGPLGNNLYVIIKAIGFFNDAEDDSMPQMLIPLSWDEVKNFFAKESIRLGKSLLTNP